MDDAATYDAGDPRQEEATRREAGRRAAADKRVIVDLMSGQEGRDWVYRVFEFETEGTDAFDINPHVTYYNLGNQRFLTAMRRMIRDVAPDLFAKMVQEQLLLKQVREDRLRKRNEGKQGETESE